MQSRALEGFWRLADPKISLASFAGIAMAALFVSASGEVAWGWLALTIAGVFAIEVGKNASGELVDFESGTDSAVLPVDRSPFSGGKRVLVDGLLTKAQCRAIAGSFFALGIITGLAIAVLREPGVVYLGLAGVALAWFYHGSPIRLSYKGLGELAVALAYGPLVVCGTYLVQTGGFSTTVFAASITLGLLVAAFLLANEFPDYNADKSVGKKNLVVQLGRPRAAALFMVVSLVAYLLLGLDAVLADDSVGVLWGCIGIIPSAFAGLRLRSSFHETRLVIPAQAAALGAFVMMALGAGAGRLWS